MDNPGAGQLSVHPRRVSTHLRLTEGVFLGSAAVAEGLVRPDDLRRRHQRLLQGVYATRGLPFDHDTKARGAALVLPPGAAIGGLSALGWFGEPMLGPVDRVTVITTVGEKWRGPRELRVHSSDLAPADVLVDLRDVPVTDPWRTAWDVAALEPLPTAVAAWDMLAHRGSLDLGGFASWVAGRAGVWGVTRVRAVLGLTDARAESFPESRVRVACVRDGLTPAVQYVVRDDDGEVIARVDLAFPELKIAVEYDGVHHFQDQQIPADDERLARLRAAGWVVLRLANADLYDLPAVVRRIRLLIDERTR